MPLELMATKDPCNGCTRKDSSCACVNRRGVRCPLWHASGMHPGLEGRECALEAHFAKDALAALGFADAAGWIGRVLTAAQAYAAGDRLVRIGRRLRCREDPSDGALARRLGFVGVGPVVRMQQRALAVDAIEDAGVWYVTVARQGSGVRRGR